MSDAPIRIALVGTGKIARDQHVAAIAGHGGYRLACCASPDAQGIDGLPHFPDLATLLADGPAVDAVALCTPPQARYALAAAALEAGKHVFLEKPPAATLGELAALDALAQSAGVTLFASWHSRFAGGVAPARAWLAGKHVRRVSIVWREDVRVWHPGQRWIWQPGGLGVFDPGINALSILTALLPGPLRLVSAVLEVPSNCAMPIAADLQLSGAGGLPISVDLDFRQTGPQSWDIVIETDGGTLKLGRGGAALTLPERESAYEDAEYAGLYAHFAALVAGQRRDADGEPLRLVADAFLLGERRTVEPFFD